MPDFRIGLLNTWTLLAAYAAGFLLALVPYSRQERSWLFEDLKYRLRGWRRLLLFLGQVVAVTFITATVFAPLRFEAPTFLAGIVLYGVGYATVIGALYYFRRASKTGPVTTGPYHFSRNPQWVGLFLVLLGTAFASGAWLMSMAVVGVAAVYHLQILAEEELCRNKYGEAYQRYCRDVPRYLLVF